jgi:hypothetical protein
MDTTITYNEMAALVANPPSIVPRPKFTNLRNLWRHIQRTLQHLSCPQSNILGWAGLIMARPMYALITMSPFWLPTDPGPLAIYYLPPTPVVNSQGAPVLDAAGHPTFVAQPTIRRAEQAMINACFSRGRNYWLSYMNIQWAVYKVLNDNINDSFKVLDDLNLVRWNPTMELQDIFDQITARYGQPTPMALLQNDTLFRSVYSPQDAPEVLFHCIEDCQEVQILGEDPYTPQKLLNNAVRLLLQCGLYTHNFDDWDQKQTCCQNDLDQPQDLCPGMLNASIKRIQPRILRICPEHIRRPNRGIE